MLFPHCGHIRIQIFILKKRSRPKNFGNTISIWQLTQKVRPMGQLFGGVLGLHADPLTTTWPSRQLLHKKSPSPWFLWPINRYQSQNYVYKISSKLANILLRSYGQKPCPYQMILSPKFGRLWVPDQLSKFFT